MVSLPTLSLLAASIEAPSLGAEDSFLFWLTNSIIYGIIVAGTLIWFMRGATKKMELIPSGKQNFVEAVIGGIYDKVSDMLGPKVAAKAFPLLATMFLFILTANWMGLLPGVGTVGWADGKDAAGHGGDPMGFMSISGDIETPLFRPPTADLNMTGGIALIFMGFWFIWSIQEVGFGGFFKHIFAPKGGLKGALWWILLPMFVFVGLIEVVSIVFRPMTLSFRLLGNIYAGESLLHMMGSMGDKLGPVGSLISGVLCQLPFYFLELLVGFLQAMVFTLLCTVYLMLSTTHEEHDEAH